MTGPAQARGAADRPDPWEVAVKLLAMRARSAQEVRQRLARRGYAAGEIAQVIARLSAARYLDDAEFARTWVRSRAQRCLLGPGRLARELRAKGIPDPEIAAALAEIAAERDVREAAAEAARRRLPTLRGLAPQAARRRLAAYLGRRGFSTEIILALCRESFPVAGGTDETD